MSTEKMREEFLAWWLDDFQRELRCSCAEGWAFHIWQASRAAIEVELPYAAEFDNPSGAWPVIQEFRGHIESLGLKVAP